MTIDIEDLQSYPPGNLLDSIFFLIFVSPISLTFIVLSL